MRPTHLQLAAVLLIVLQCCWSSSKNNNYDGYKTFRIVGSSSQLQKVLAFRGRPGFDFWKEPSMASKEIDVMVAPEVAPDFVNFLDHNRIEYDVTMNDVGRVIEKENRAQLRAGFARWSSDQSFQMNRFYRFDEFTDYMKWLASTYPKICQIEPIGKSYEGRQIYMLKISSNFAAKKPIFLMEAGMHAREWAGPMTVTYFINQLVENYTQNAAHLKKIDWYIIPVANPDGYEYTHTDDRMWRKTRKPLTTCIGVDANRNFGYHWAEAGSSDDECQDIYHGPKAFSEIEAVNIKNVGQKYAQRIAIYTAVHSYGSFFLYPWGFAKTLPKDWRNLQSCGEAANKAINKVFGTSYVVGTSARTLYEAAGGSDDYFKGVLNVSYAYTVELPGTPAEGFALPPHKLMNTGIETFEGFKVLSKCPFRKNKMSDFNSYDYENNRMFQGYRRYLPYL